MKFLVETWILFLWTCSSENCVPILLFLISATAKRILERFGIFFNRWKTVYREIMFRWNFRLVLRKYGFEVSSWYLIKTLINGKIIIKVGILGKKNVCTTNQQKSDFESWWYIWINFLHKLNINFVKPAGWNYCIGRFNELHFDNFPFFFISKKFRNSGWNFHRVLVVKRLQFF